MSSALAPSSFPPKTDKAVVECFKAVGPDRDGRIDDKALHKFLSKEHSFDMRTVHLLMYNFTRSHDKKIGPKEFVDVYNDLRKWKKSFQQADRDRNGKIDAGQLQEALENRGLKVANKKILEQLFLKFSKPSGAARAIGYDGFIECCLTIKRLDKGFNAAANQARLAAFKYEDFMLAVLPCLPGF